MANNTLANTNIADNAVDATKIASNSILTRHIDDNQVTADQIAAATVTTTQIAANTIATGNVADNAIDGTKIAQNSILTRHIDDAQITTGHIIDVNVTTAKIADDAVTADKLAHDINLVGNPTTTTQSGSNSTTRIATTAFVQQEITTLIGGAPSTLNDLNELAAAINDDANYNSTLTTALATKLPLAGGTMTGNLIVNAIVDADNFKINNAQGSDGQVLTSTGSGVAWEDASSFNADAAQVFNDSGADVDFRVESDGNANMLFVDGGNDRVGVGTASPADRFQVNHTGVQASSIRSSATNNDAYFAVGNSDMSDFIVLFGGHSGNSGSTLGWDDSNNLRFSTYQNHTGTYGATRMQIDADGTIQLGNPATGAATNVVVMPTGKLFLDAGGNTYITESAGDVIDVVVGGSRKLRVNSNGLIFNSDTAAANALNDYEEGTWTPALDNITTNSSTMYGIYTKIGRIVHIHAKIDATVASLPGAQFQISGLPFTAKDAGDTGQRAIIAVGGDAVNLGGNAPKMHFITNGSNLQALAWNASNDTASHTYNGGDSNDIELHIHGHYTT